MMSGGYTANDNMPVPQIDLLPAQKQFIHCDPDVTLDVALYQGGYGSGKTFSGSLLGLLLAQKYQGCIGLVLGKTYRLLADTTLVAYRDHLDRLGLVKGEHYHFIKSEQRFIFHCWGDSEIWFRHMEDPERIKSITCSWIECEEMSMFTEADFNMMLSRLRDSRFPRCRLFGHTNPQSSKGWIHKFFVEKNSGKKRFVTDDGRENIIHYRRVIAPTTENTFLPASYVENMKNQYDADYYKINVLGQDGDYSAGLVCKGFGRANIENVTYNPDYTIYLSCDFNVDPMCWALAHRINGEYHFFDEICLENVNTELAAAEFVSRYGAHLGNVVLTGDASGASRSVQSAALNDTNFILIKNAMVRGGMRTPEINLAKSNPLIVDRVAAWNAAVKNSNNVRSVFIDPRCTWLIFNCENLKFVVGSSVIWAPTRAQIEQNRNFKFIGHIFDAASYLVWRYSPIKADDEARKPPPAIRAVTGSRFGSFGR